MDIGIKIKKLREHHNVSQSELCDHLSISQASLSNIENGVTRSVDFEMVDKLCKKFEVGFDYFIGSGQNNNIEKNEGTNGMIGNNYNYGTVNNTPDSVLEQVKQLVEANKTQSDRIQQLEEELKTLKKRP